MSEHHTSGQKDLVRELYRTIYEQKAFDAVPDFYAPDAVRHGGLRGSVEGHEALQGYLAATLGGLSEIEVTELHCLAEDDLIAYDFEMAATHSGELLGVPATGNRIEMTNTAWFRIENGQVTDEWPRTDMLGLVKGLDLVELPF
ncbi:ester cyclase [Salinigranum salinum]|uniref:ester cyclase n=1 Tax=Salinigranum salinum TaxID=1364937 RepID=UPI001260FAFA|nr:ester cyclase [Salinigranum salinum]